MGNTNQSAFDSKPIMELDPWLEPFLPAIAHRQGKYEQWKNTINDYEGGYDKFSKGWLKFGLNVDDKGEITYREWAPNPVEANLIGDFSALSLSALTA